MNFFALTNGYKSCRNSCEILPQTDGTALIEVYPPSERMDYQANYLGDI
jgi:hypothetical protein